MKLARTATYVRLLKEFDFILNTVLIVETTDQKEFMFRRNISQPGV